MPTDRVNFLDVQFDRLTFHDVKARLQSVSHASRYAYVVTPNVDHVVRIHREDGLLGLYEMADLCLCDSRILWLLARLRGIKLPLVAGSDLAQALFTDVIRPRDKIAVIGGTTDFIDRLRLKFPAIEFVHHEPPMGLRYKPDALRSAASFVASARPRFAFIAVGSPQQEMIAKEVRNHSGAVGMALCIGAGLEFLTGEQKRAPRLLQAVGLEWAHRLLSNPRRLWRRYLVDGPAIFPIYAKWRKPTERSKWPAMALVLIGIAGGLIYVTVGRGGQQPAHAIEAKLPQPASAQSLPLGLPPPNLLRPLSPEEAAKENAERPFVDRPDSAASKFVLRTDAEDHERAITCLTQAVYYEAASEGVDGERAVAQVVLNRLHHPGYPASVCGVVYQGAERPTGCQFTFACDGSLQREPIAALWARSRKVAEDALAGKVFAPVGHATHYHADYVLPYWADSLDKTLQIGRHIFYRLRNSLGDSRSFFQRYAGSEPPIPQPGTALVLPSSPDSQKLADALISDDLNGLVPEVEKVAQAASPLVIDSSRGTLIGDQQGSAASSPRPKPASDCPIGSDGKKLAPLGANDMRSGAGQSTCG